MYLQALQVGSTIICSCVSIDPMNLLQQKTKMLRARHSQNDVSVALII